MAAGALAARPLIRLGYEELFQASRTMDDGAYDAPPPEQVEAEHQARIYALSVQVLASTVAVAGTLLCGYGDMLGHWLFALRAR